MQNIAHYEVNVLSEQTKVSRVGTTAGDVSTDVWKWGQRDSSQYHSSSTAEFSLREEELTANNFLSENCLKPKIKKLPESHRNRRSKCGYLEVKMLTEVKGGYIIRQCRSGPLWEILRSEANKGTVERKKKKKKFTVTLGQTDIPKCWAGLFL